VLRVSVASSASRLLKLWVCSPVVVRLLCALRFAAAERLALATGSAVAAGCSSLKSRGSPGFAQVPGQVVAEHAEKDVGSDALFEVMVDGTDLELGALECLEGALDLGQLLVGAHDLGGRQLGLADVGAQDVDAFERRLGRDLF